MTLALIIWVFGQSRVVVCKALSDTIGVREALSDAGQPHGRCLM